MMNDERSNKPKTGHQPRATSHWLLLALALAFLASPLLTPRLRPNQYAGGRSRDAGARETRNASAVALMLGEFRTSMSDMMFVKTERYLHGGVAYKPHKAERWVPGAGADAAGDAHDDEQHKGQDDGHQDEAHVHGPGCGHEGHEGHEQEAGAECTSAHETLIHAKAKDFRGLIGDWQRAVKPWHADDEASRHTDRTEILPWYRLMTLSDPHSVRAYTVGAYWLRGLDPEQALKFIEEGRARNPDSFQIHLMHGRICFHRAGGLQAHAAGALGPEQRKDMLRALASYKKAAELALLERATKLAAQTPPPKKGAAAADDEPPELLWSVSDEEDALAAARLAVFLEQHYGDPAQARRMAREYADRLDHDAVLERYARSGAGAPNAKP